MPLFRIETATFTGSAPRQRQDSPRSRPRGVRKADVFTAGRIPVAGDQVLALQDVQGRRPGRSGAPADDVRARPSRPPAMREVQESWKAPAFNAAAVKAASATCGKGLITLCSLPCRLLRFHTLRSSWRPNSRTEIPQRSATGAACLARPPITSPWTPEQDEKLKALAAKGASAIRAAGALKRTISGVRVRARKLGVAFPTVREIRRKLADPDRKRNDISPY
jgi:hypothetical protein